MGLDTYRSLQQRIASAGSINELKDPLQELALIAATGHEEAGDLLLVTIDRWRLVRAPIARQLFDPSDQDDVEQHALLAVTRSITSFKGDANVMTWLHRLATNCALGFVRRRRELTGLPTEHLASETVRFTSVVANQAIMRDAIERLPEHYRLAVTLRDIEQLSYAEVAERLGLNINTTRAHIARGRARVAQTLTDQKPGVLER